MLEQISLRIRQLHHALGEARSSDDSLIHVERVNEPGRNELRVDFSGGASDAELANSVSLLIANIACLKDYLKNWCNARHAPFHGDTLINSNRDVAIIHDLWNRDKHAALNRSRSNLFPVLGPIQRVASLSVGKIGSAAGMFFNFDTCRLEKIGDGKIEFVLNAEIFDDAGQRVGELMQVSERAVDAWTKMFREAGVPIEAPATP
jgi:hypothetical protein